MAISYTATVDGYDYGFDFDAEYIYVDAALDDIYVEELYTAIKEAQASQQGVVCDVIAKGTGLDELDTGVSTFLTVRVFGEWELRSNKSSGKVTTRGGNLVKDNGNDPFYDDGSVFYIAFFSQAGIKTTVETGVSGVIPQDLQDFADALMDRIMENGETFAEQVRLIRAEAAGDVEVSGNTVYFKNAAGDSNRITSTTDSSGQRTNVVDGS